MKRIGSPIVLFFLLLIYGQKGSGQVVDSIRYFMQEDPSFMTKFDTRHSFISSRHGKIFGLKFGVEHSNRVNYGGGINWLINKKAFRRDLTFQDSTVQGKLHFWFLSPFFEYTFYQSQHWNLSMPVRMGFGAAAFEFYDPQRDKNIFRRRTIFIYEPVMTVQYKFWRYFGLGAGVGYRLIYFDHSLIPSKFDQSPYRFTSPIYILRFNVFFGKMYKDVFRREEQ